MGSVKRYGLARHRRQPAKVSGNDDRNEDPQQQNELALRDQIGLAGFVNQFRDFPHRAMHRQVLQAHVNRHAKSEPEQAEQNSDQQQLVTVDGAIEKADRATGRAVSAKPPRRSFAGRLCERRSRAHRKQRNYGREFHRHAADKERSSGKPGTHMSPPY